VLGLEFQFPFGRCPRGFPSVVLQLSRLHFFGSVQVAGEKLWPNAGMSKLSAFVILLFADASEK
jgi:hypothetical protein